MKITRRHICDILVALLFCFLLFGNNIPNFFNKKLNYNSTITRVCNVGNCELSITLYGSFNQRSYKFQNSKTELWLFNGFGEQEDEPVGLFLDMKIPTDVSGDNNIVEIETNIDRFKISFSGYCDYYLSYQGERVDSLVLGDNHYYEFCILKENSDHEVIGEN